MSDEVRTYAPTTAGDEMSSAGPRDGPSGKWTVQYPDSSWYDGWLLGGEPHGEGTMWDAQTSTKYNGSWKHGKAHGIGTLVVLGETKYKYSGEFANGKEHGTGTASWGGRRRGTTYTGTFRDGAAHGDGRSKHFSDGWYVGCHEGRYRHGKRHGFGKWWAADQATTCAGVWKHGVKKKRCTPLMNLALVALSKDMKTKPAPYTSRRAAASNRSTAEGER